MIDFITHLFKRLFGQSGSSATAKERLRLVLMTDHLELAPDMIDAMKRDFVDVISRYVEVDRERIEVTFEQQNRTLAMLANIPILSVNRPNGNGKAKKAQPPAPSTAPTVASAPNVASPGAQAATDSIVVRRRRRRKKNQAGNSQPRPAPAR
jgi:cell division topological specificity factor